jgi:hypothetical protein
MCKKGGSFGSKSHETDGGHSPAQAAERANWRTAADAWNKLTDEQKAQWQDWWRHLNPNAKSRVSGAMPSIGTDMEGTSRLSNAGSGMGDGYNAYIKVVKQILRVNKYATPPQNPPAEPFPDPPENLTLTNNGSGGITANWTPSLKSDTTITITIKGTGDLIHKQIVINAPAKDGHATFTTVAGKNGVKLPVSAFKGTTITGRAIVGIPTGLHSAGTERVSLKIQ